LEQGEGNTKRSPCKIFGKIVWCEQNPVKNKEWYCWLYSCGDIERGVNTVTPAQDDKIPES
jgi:hypothetical protein